MGERRARWGFGYQDKVATDRILTLLRKDLAEGTTEFEGIRLADLDAGRVDDFVLVWSTAVEGNSIKWSGNAAPLTWGDLIGSAGLLRELADGYQRLRNRWPSKAVSVRLHTNRPASGEKHHAQLIPTISVFDFLSTSWPVGPVDQGPNDLTETWRKITYHVGLSRADLVAFVSSCRFSLGAPEPPAAIQDSLDSRHYRQQFDNLHKAISTWLTNTPDGDFINKHFLLTAIGVRPRRRWLIQRFPEPDIPYEKNHAVADQLGELIETTPGGYLAVLGSAGIGKSTLVQDVLTDPAYPFFIPYYAFLPSTDDNRDRGEALTFFEDVVARLDRFSSNRQSLGITDVAQGRDALRQHMAKANERYVSHGHKTVLLIDGLDHVTREISLQVPVLHELPPPNEVPDGFVIILSGQPQAFVPGTLPPQVAISVKHSGRRLEVSGLSRTEVHTLVSQIDKPTTRVERDELYKACLGNPLILTYLLAQFERTAESTVAEAIESVGHYVGGLDQYYRERLSIPLESNATRHLLGLLCRAAPSISVAWLQEWPEKGDIEDIYLRVLAPFLRIEDGTITFIHDSLIAFLKSETRSRLPGSDAAADEKAFHSVLAARSRNRPCIDPVGRARILHLLRAERYVDLLAQLSSEWVREAMHGFLPYAHIRRLLAAGFAAAWTTSNWGHVLRLMLLDYELDQRTSRTEAGTLAHILLDLDQPDLALSQIRSGSRFLVDDKVALEFSGSLWRHADHHDHPDLKMSARRLYLQAKPISLFYQPESIDATRRDEQESLIAWSEVAPLFEHQSLVVQEIQKLTFTEQGDRRQVDPTDNKVHYLFRALGTAIDAGREAEDCQVFVDAIDALQRSTARFAALFRLAESIPSAVPFDVIQTAHGAAKASADVELAYAWFLIKQEHRAEAIETIHSLHHVRFEPYRETHRWGFTDITYTVSLRWLQEQLGVPEGALPEVNDDREEATARVERTARDLGHLRALVATRGMIPELHSVFRSLLLFHNQPVRFETMDRHYDHIVRTSRSAIYREVAKLARAMGMEAVGVLRDVVLDLTNGPAGMQFGPHHRRYFAQVFFETGVMSREQTLELGLSSTGDVLDEDPIQRQKACLEVATLLHRVSDQDGSRDWMRKASEVTAGAGSHKDYHMGALAEWLVRSIDRTEPRALTILDRFARALEVAGGEGGSTGAQQLLQLLMRLNPASASRLATEFIDRQVLNVSDVIEALIVGGAGAKAGPELVAAMYGELYTLIAPDDTSAAGLAVLRSYPHGQRIEAAVRLMAYARTNVLPSHRAPVARAFQDAVREDGLGSVVLTSGLQPGHDDSSRKGTLYRLANGNVETIEEVATRLGDPDRRENWNPNPKENNEFDWWAAIKSTKVKSVVHFDSLLGAFPPPDYREVECLARKAELALELGDRLAARQLAEDALTHAKDGSWHLWVDSAQKRTALTVLKRIDRAEGVARAREYFASDLGAGKLYSSFLLSDIGKTIDLLDIDWPAEAVQSAVSDYLDQVLAANVPVPRYSSLDGPVPSWSADHALCRFLTHLVAFPVVDVAVATRRVLAQYFATDGRGIVAMMTGDPWWDPCQLEHILVAVHVGSRSGLANLDRLQNWIENLNASESLAVRSIAKRICEEQKWHWEEIATRPTQPVILLPGSPALERDVDLLLGGDGDVEIAWTLFGAMIATFAQPGLDKRELRSEFEREYLAIQKRYHWADDEHLKRWINLVLTRVWLNPRVIVGREAAMRVFGKRSLSGQIPPGAEEAYDVFYPIYDSHIELCEPKERPKQLGAMDWRITGEEGQSWLSGVGADSWSNYPEWIDGFQIIGERTWFVRPEWEWPREERHRGILAGPLDSGSRRQSLESDHELTHEMYLAGRAQKDGQLTVLNSERLLSGPRYRWAALNANFARTLGWYPSAREPFHWKDAAGATTAKSVYWRDGWIQLEPPRFESLGEGWLVLATPEAVDAIRLIAPATEVHLWVERHSHGDKPYDARWHLSREL